MFILKHNEKKKSREKTGEMIRVNVKSTPFGYCNNIDGFLYEFPTDARIAGEQRLEKDDIERIVDKVQYTMLETAQDIWDSTLNKKRIYNGMEFLISSGIWNLADRNKEAIHSIVEAGIHTDCKKVAKALEVYINKGRATYCRQYPNMMKRLNGRVPGDLIFEAFRFARNELAETYHKSAIEGYKANPYVVACRWLLADNRIKKYADLCNCNDLAYQDKFGFGPGIYPIGSVPERPHVMCLCNTAPVSSKKLRQAITEGLVIGNVPTEEWLEAQKKNDGQFELDFSFNFFNRKKEAQSPLDVLNFGSLSKDEKFKADIDRVDKGFLNLFNSCINKPRIDINYKGLSHYNPNNNTIKVDLFKENPFSRKAGFNKNMVDLLHETGHYLDHNILNKKGALFHNKMPNFREALTQDALNYINSVYRKALGSSAVDFKNLSPMELNRVLQVYKDAGYNMNVDLSKLVGNELAKNPYINSAMSDMVGGLTQNRMIDTSLKIYGHETAYWQNPNAILYEATAHMFEAMGSGGERLEAMKEFFPFAYELFAETLGKL